jgi:hypothetical protein
MKLLKSFFSLIISLVFLSISSSFVSAHQPVIPATFPLTVENPEISRAFYSITASTPELYKISSDKAFDLYVNILVPDLSNQSKDLFVTVIKKGKTDKQITYLDGTKFTWTKMFEQFGHDNYLQGPEFKLQAGAGDYEIRVFSKVPKIKYTLAIGETESFGLTESLNTISIIPILKVNFFNKNPIDFLLSPIGAGYVAIILVLSFVFGFIFSFIMRKYTKGKVRRRANNIGTSDRLLRFSIFAVLFLTAVTTTWNGIYIFVAGFCLFEAIFSWCVLYALMGKNTCPI